MASRWLTSSGRVLLPPVDLCRKYKGNVESRALADTVQFQGDIQQLFLGREAAREVVTGKKMSTNGWSFWQVRDDNGKLRELTVIRKQYQSASTRMSQA